MSSVASECKAIDGGEPLVCFGGCGPESIRRGGLKAPVDFIVEPTSTDYGGF